MIPNNLATDDHNCEVNWDPRSDDMSMGIPKSAIQWYMRARAQPTVDMSLRGTASGQREKRSTIVKRWVKPSEGGPLDPHKCGQTDDGAH